MSLRRYLPITSAWWQRGLTYRNTILAYRFGEIAEYLILVLLWSRLFGDQPLIYGYTKSEMITYFLVGSIVTAAVRTYARDSVARDIRDGGLSAFLVKPMSYLKYVTAREFGRVSLPAILSVLTSLIVLIPFYSMLVSPASTGHFLMMLAMLVLAIIIDALMSMLVGFITFWTDETEAIFDVILRLKRFFSGGYFPLSIAPAFLLTLTFWLPFGYSFFIPMQLYLGKMTILQGVYGLGIEAGWIIILYILVRVIYARGLKRYEGINM